MVDKALAEVVKLARAEEDRDLFAIRKIAAQETRIHQELNDLERLSECRSTAGADTAFYLQGEENWRLWLGHQRAELNRQLMLLRVQKEFALTQARKSSGRAQAATSLVDTQMREAAQKAENRAFETVFDLGLLTKEADA